MRNEVFVLALVEDCKNAHPQHFLGRTALQKLTFFAKQLGVPLELPFRLHFYGPFSEELEALAFELQIDGLMRDDSPDRNSYSNYRLTDRGRQELRKQEDQVAPWRDLIQKLAENLGGLEPLQLELLSTIRFSFARNRKGTDADTRKAVIAEVAKVKKDRFTRKQIGDYYDLMTRVGFLS